MPTTPLPAQPPRASVDESCESHPEALTLKAALWDMDGTLVDTEPYWIAAETQLVTSHGGHWDHHLASSLVGCALETSALILQDAGVQLGVREIVDGLSAQVIEEIKAHIPWRPGARELLSELHQQGVRCVLVTMSEGPLAREVVSALDHDYFEFLVTGDQVINGKPHPEPYLTAVERLQVSDPDLQITNCVAFEDSIPGVASALASGVPTIAVPNFVPLPQDSRRVTWETLEGKSVRHVVAAMGSIPQDNGAQA